MIDQTASMIFKEAHLSQSLFEKVLKQKNACLRSIRFREISISKGREIIDSLDQVMIPIAADVLYLRFKIIHELTPKIEKILQEITGKKSVVEIQTVSQKMPWSETKYEKIKERIEKEIKYSTNRVIEEATGYSHAGPHRQEVTFFLDGRDTRLFSSQGQQRALILAFKMAEIVYHSESLGTQPLLLLDDVLSEFDEDKQRYLLDFLQKNEAQTFLTATNTTSLLKNANIFHLKAGTVTTNAD